MPDRLTPADQILGLEADKFYLVTMQARYQPHGPSGISTRMYWAVTSALMALDVEIAAVKRPQDGGREE